MERRNVWLICGTAVAVVEVLSAFARSRQVVSAEAMDSLRHTLFLVAGVGSGRLEASGRLRGAVWAAIQTGVVMGAVSCLLNHVLSRRFGLVPGEMAGMAMAHLLVVCFVTVLTAATLAGLGGIAGWGVRRAVEPAD